MNPKLKIFVLTYNRVNYLKECLESILNQTFRDFQVVILDNASEQDVESVVTSFHDERLKLMVNSSNVGLVGNFIKAFDLVESDFDYFMIFHDDDCMPSNMIASQLRVFSEHPNVGFVSTGVNLVYQDSAMFDLPDDEFHYEIFNSPYELLSAFFSSRQFGFGSIMYRTEIAKMIRPDIDRFASIFDRPYMLSLSEMGPSAFLAHPSLNARQHQQQDSAVRAWTYFHEIEMGRHYLDVSRSANRGWVIDRVVKQLVQNFVVRRPRVTLRGWLRRLEERDMFYWRPLIRYLPYYFFRNAIAGRIKSSAPALYQQFVRTRKWVVGVRHGVKTIRNNRL
jgi:glycosyltransferase involved in cell wall biosynthesis